MKQNLIFLFIVLTSCKTDKDSIVFTATNKYDLGYEEQLVAFSDSTFLFTTKKGHIEQVIDSVSGKWYISDKKYIFNFDSNLTYAKQRNGFIEFEEIELKLKIDAKESTEPKNLSFFHFNTKKYSPRNYNYDSTKVSSYELNEQQLQKLNSIIQNCFLDNKKVLRDYNEYIFQAIPVKNQDQIEVWVYGYCKDPFIEKGFRYRIIQMCDGENCNIGFKVNLTKNEYSEFGVSGEA